MAFIDQIYDPKLVVVTINGVPVEGYGEDSIIKAEMDEDAITLAKGCDGSITFCKNPHHNGTITFTLKGNSPSLKWLTQLAILQPVAVVVKDLNTNGRSFSAFSCMLKKKVTIEFKKEMEDVEVELLAARLDLNS